MTDKYVSQNSIPHLDATGQAPLGWIDPDGRFWEVPWGKHDDFARWMLGSEDPYAGDKLMKQRWAKLANEAIHMPRHPSAAQKKALFDWLGKRSMEFAGEGLLNAGQFMERYGCLSKRIQYF